MINIQHLIRKNLPVKICALIAAVILWAYVMNTENPAVNATFTIPIQVVNAPEGYSVQLSEKEVSIRVRASRDLIASVNENSFRAEVDIAGNAEGDTSEKIHIVVPQGFELLEQSEDSVMTTLEGLIARGVPVEIVTTGKPAMGVTVGQVVPAQSYVNVYGPRHVVESIVRVQGKAPLADNQSDFSLRVKLVAVDKEGDLIHNLSVLPGEMDVTVHLAKGLIKKIVPVTVDLVNNLSDEYQLDSVTVEPAQLEVTGDEKLLERLASIPTMAVSLEGVDGDTTRDVELAAPAGVTTPNKKVTVKIKATKK